MAVRTKAQLEAAFAALYADGQADDSITAARIRAFWVDFAESLLDNPAILQGALDANIVTSMLRDSAVERTKIGDDAVTSAKIEDGAVTGPKIAAAAAARIVDILEGLASGKLDIVSGTQGNIPLARIPTTVARASQLANYRTEAQINTLIGQALANAVTGNTETNIVVTYSNGKLNFVASGGGTPPPPASHTRYWARSADTTFTAGEFTSATTGRSFTTDRITQPTWTGNEYIALAVPNDTGDITRIEIDNQNQTGAFQRVTGTITISGVAYKVWRSNNAVNGSGDVIVVTQG